MRKRRGMTTNVLKEFKASRGRDFIAATRCLRCGGFMVDEPCSGFMARRCIQCGELVDPVIAQNRRHPSTSRRNGGHLGQPKQAA